MSTIRVVKMDDLIELLKKRQARNDEKEAEYKTASTGVGDANIWIATAYFGKSLEDNYIMMLVQTLAFEVEEPVIRAEKDIA